MSMSCPVIRYVLYLYQSFLHLVIEVEDLLNFNVVEEGRKLRNSSLFLPQGINVNFVSQKNNSIFIRTYERGVEDETLSCGTGAISAALVSQFKGPLGPHDVRIHCQGGTLGVRFKKNSAQFFSDIWLTGIAILTFNGEFSP